ncbi:MAG: tetratricopeptide repeat protein [Treponema sp.]|nr:tetratricopeptide repeat protein [Treponema sp.]
MPSLNELGKFKSSFSNIANEKKDVLANKLPYDDLKLPAKEAPPFNYSRNDFAVSKPSEQTAPDADTPSGSETGDFDFSAFVNGISDDAPPDDISGGAEAALDDFLKDLNPDNSQKELSDDGSSFLEAFQNDQEALSDNEPAGDDFSAPDDLLAGFSEEMESAPDDFKTDDLSDDNLLDDDMEPAIDMGGESPHIADAGQPAEGTSAEETSDEVPDDSLADFGADDFGTDDFDLDEEPGIDLGGEAPHVADSDAGAEDSGDFSLDDFTSDDFSSESFESQDSIESQDSSGSQDESPDFSLPGADDFGGDFSDGSDDSSLNDDFGSPPSGLTSGGDASIDFGDFGADFQSDSIDLDNETPEEQHSSDTSSEAFGSDDFALDVDDILNKSSAAVPPKPEPKKGFAFGKKKGADVPAAEDSVEEISLTQDDVDSILKTLSSFPLNLRIICQELIAEQVILPAQLSKLIRLLINGAGVKETAALVEEITGKPVVIPKSFEKMTGAAFEDEQSSFAYIFIHNFLPVLRLFAFIAAVAFSVIYLSYRFIYTPLHAESIYKRGYERIPEGEYQRANELFHQAFTMHKKKKWFYLYAEAFRDHRRYTLAEGKYDELLRFYPRDKKGVLDYADLNTNYILNYEKANRLLQRELLDFAPNDYEGLLATGDNFFAWADSNPSLYFDRYEDARFSYARLLELYGWAAPVVQRMMMYFIRTDDLKETLNLRRWFESDPKRRKLSAETLAELGGYLLDKQLEKTSGVPDPYIESIESVRAMLLEAVSENPYLPEPHYHLARYHHNLSNTYDERLTLENAIRAFDLANQESVRRRLYRVDTHYRYANLLINNREFFPADEELVKGIGLYEDFLTRNLINPSAQLGQLYALRGDLEYFVKSGDMRTALDRFYHVAESYGYAPPEVQYRMGSAYYQLGDWGKSLEYLFKASSELPLNRRLLYALGNTAYQRRDFFAAQGYYNRLIDVLESQRVRMPSLLPNDNPLFLELGERLMMARNNAGAVGEALADQTGNRDYRSRALAMYAESARAWDAITRNPETMARMSLTGSPGAPGINLGYLNANNALRPNANYTPQIFVRIDRDVLEPSKWEELAGN